jgi:excisionase family DNA binding protein
MNHPDKKSRKVRGAKPSILIGEPNRGHLSTKAAGNEVRAVPLDPSDSPGKPAPPLMLTPRIAWRRLCAATGAGIAMRTFYLWIATGKIDSVRMGRNTLIPAEALDNLINLINQCLAGLMLTPRLALRRLCAGTGCEIGIETLYLWIATGKIDSVRTGRNILIPVEALDNLIERCLRGERLY